MREVIVYYQRWVNGADVPLKSLLFARMPSEPPGGVLLPAPQPPPEIRLVLQAYEGEPALPALDPRDLAPVAHVLVHGSAATRDGCAFSDVDIAVFLEDLRTFSLEQHHRAIRSLRTLLRAALEYDALMHHGLMFAPASALRAYDQRFLPVEALRCARTLHGPKEVSLRVSPAQEQLFKRALAASAASLRRHFANGDFLSNDFRFKQVLAGILLMPARVLAARGTHVYKRDSFDLAREWFTPLQWELIARSEALRATWLRPKRSCLARHIPQSAAPGLLASANASCAPRLNVTRLSQRTKAGLERSAATFLTRAEAFAS